MKKLKRYVLTAISVIVVIVIVLATYQVLFPEQAPEYTGNPHLPVSNPFGVL